MRVIRIETCKTCPYRRISHDFKNSKYYLKCGKQYLTYFKVLSVVKYEKKLLDYTIPVDCPLEVLDVWMKRVEQ